MNIQAQNPERDDIVKRAFKYRDALLCYSFSILRDWDAADDAVQETFLVVMNKYKDFKEGTNLFKWVRQILHYKALERIRAKKKETPVEQDELAAVVADTMEEAFTEEKAQKANKMRKALHMCMSKLNKMSVDLIAGFYWHKHSCEKLAAKVKKSVNSVRLLLSRLRTKLHDCMVERMQRGEV